MLADPFRRVKSHTAPMVGYPSDHRGHLLKAVGVLLIGTGGERSARSAFGGRRRNCFLRGRNNVRAIVVVQNSRSRD